MLQNSQLTKVIVFGAGIAGLACSQRLHEAGIEFQLLEASDRFGGRIKPLLGHSKLPLEAGGQCIHHSDNQYYKMALEAGAILEDNYDCDHLVWDEY